MRHRPSSITLGVAMSCLLMLLLLIADQSAYAQFIERATTSQTPSSNETLRQYEFWHNSNIDAAERTQTPVIEGETKKIDVSTKKSGLLAAGLSLILPGLGEYYVGDDIWRGLIFTAVEGGLWYGRLRYLSRGDDSLIAFHAWADSLWSPKKYSDSLNSLLSKTNRDYRISDPNNFAEIHEAEDTLDFLGFQNFTHRLPDRGSQQYYELISKYIQFTWGWRDAVSQDPNASKEYQRHADMRANMNYQYDAADYFLWGMLLNRVLSAIDAALLAKNHNSAIHVQGELVRRPLSNGLMGYVPTAKLHWTF